MSEAKLKPQVYKDPRPASFFDQYHRRARRARGFGAIYALVRFLMTPPTYLFFRLKSIDMENVPATDPVILACNHFSQFDHFFAGVRLRRYIQFMAKSQLFKPPLSFILTHGGVFPVRRGYDDQEAFITAKTILDKGGMVLIYCEGGRSRTGELGEPKRGVGKVALDSGAPVVPVAIRSPGVRNWTRLRFPKVQVQYGEPMHFDAVPDSSRQQQDEVAAEIFDQVKRLYAGLDAQSA